MSILGGDQPGHSLCRACLLAVARRFLSLCRAGLVTTALFLPAGAVFHGRAPAQQPAGDRLIARERRERIEFQSDLIRRIRDLDNALIASGRDDLSRHQRINRLIEIDATLNGASYESTAVLVSLLDELTRDQEVKASHLNPRILRARTAALQRIVVLIPGTRLPVSDDLPAMERHLAGRSGGESDSLPTPVPPPPPRSVTSVLMEETATGFAPVPGSGCRTLRFLPGSRHVLSGDGRDLHVVDLEKQGAAERIASAVAEPPPVISSSGEYVALVTPVESTLEIQLIRRLTDTAPRTALSGHRVDALRFHPRELTLAVILDGNLDLIDAASGTVRRITDEAGAGSTLAWSPDGDHLALFIPSPEEAGVRTTVFETATGVPVLNTLFAGRTPVWYADNRSLTSIAFSPAAGGMTLFIERRTVDGLGSDQLPLFDMGAGSTVGGPAWSPDGRQAAFRIQGGSDVPVADGFPESAFFRSTSALRTIRFPVPDNARYDPPAAELPEFAWHPSGRWYAARQDFAEGGGLFLHDLHTGDAFLLGNATARRPLFSPDGRRVLWVERAASGERFAFLDLSPVPGSLARSREFAARGSRALAAGQFKAASVAFRNAVRLTPGDPRALQGLGRSYTGAAFEEPFAPWKAGFLEAAVTVLGQAMEQNSTSPDIRIDFLDSIGRLAWIQGKLESRQLIDRAQKRLADPPGPGDTERRRYSAEIRDALVEAALWDPDNEYARILLDGILARFPEGKP